MKLKLIFFLLIIFLTGCNNTDVPDNPNEPDEIPDSVEVTSIVVNSKNNVSSGETMKIKVQAIMSNGEKKDITEDSIINSSNENFAIIDNDSIVVSEEALTADSFTITIKYEDFLEKVKIDVFNSLKDNIDSEGVITNPSSFDAVMNKSRNLPSDYIPEDLVTLSVPTCLLNPEVNQLRSDASQALTALFESAKEKELILVARSGYRSYNTQTALYNGIVNKYGQDYADKYSAKPGQSEHQTGLAIDITSESVALQLEEPFGETPEGIWVKENAHLFGFIIRYPKGKESITGYEYEPWHLRYLGKNLATEVYESGLTLEEFFEQ